MRCSLGSRKSELTLINVKAIVYANISTLLCFGVSDLSADWQKAQINPNSRQLVLGGKNYFAAIAIADQSVLGGKNCFAAIAIADQLVLGGQKLLRYERASSLSLRYYWVIIFPLFLANVVVYISERSSASYSKGGWTCLDSYSCSLCSCFHFASSPLSKKRIASTLCMLLKLYRDWILKWPELRL